ncbi:MAG: hypothetical protein WDZ74_02315 [Candidatus Paceibacterota bacterium]
MKKFLALIVPVLLMTPLLALAQTPDEGAVINYINAFQSIINAAIPFLIAVAVVAILYGLAVYAFSAGDEAAQDKGRRIMVTGVIILFVMVAIWGFVNVLNQFFFSGSPGNVPDAPGTPAGTPAGAPAGAPGGPGGVI